MIFGPMTVVHCQTVILHFEEFNITIHITDVCICLFTVVFFIKARCYDYFSALLRCIVYNCEDLVF